MVKIPISMRLASMKEHNHKIEEQYPTIINEFEHLLSGGEEVLFVINKRKSNLFQIIGFVIFSIILLILVNHAFMEEGTLSMILTSLMVAPLYILVTIDFFESFFSAQVIITNKKILYKNLFTGLKYSSIEFNNVYNVSFDNSLRSSALSFVVNKVKGFPLILFNTEEYVYKIEKQSYKKVSKYEFSPYLNENINKYKCSPKKKTIDEIKYIIKAITFGALFIIVFFAVYIMFDL